MYGYDKRPDPPVRTSPAGSPVPTLDQPIGGMAYGTARLNKEGVTEDEVVANIGIGDIEAIMFAEGIEPVAIVDTLPNPVGYTGPLTVFLTTDQKLYRYDSGVPEFVRTHETTDLTGQIVGTQITDGAITTPKIFAGAVTADEIGANAVTADKLIADAVTAGKIAAGAINTQALFVDGVVSAKKLTIQDPTNLIANPVFSGGSSEDWFGFGSSALVVAAAATPDSANCPAAYAAELTTQTWNVDIHPEPYQSVQRLPVQPGELLFCEAWVVGDGSENTAFRMGAITYDRDGANPNYVAFLNYPAGSFTTWTKVSGFVTIPAGDYLANLWFSVPGDPSPTGKWYGTQMNIRRAGGVTIEPSGITAGNIAVNAVTAGTIEAGAVIAGKLAVGSVDASTVIANGIIVTNHITVGTLDGDRILANSITATEIAALTITANEIAVGTITANEIAANTILAGNIAANAIESGEIKANAVIAGKIAAGAINASTIIVDGMIVTAHMAAGTIDADRLVANSIQAGQIASNAVDTLELNALSVTAAKIAVNAIEAGHISAGAVDAGTISAGAINASNIIVNGIIITAHMSAGTINADRLSALSITSGLIQADAIVAAKIDAGAIQAGHIAAGAINATNIIANGMILTAHMSAGTINADRLSSLSITSGLIQADAIIAGKLAVGSVDGSTVIAGGVIVTSHMSSNSIHGDRISAGTIAAVKIVAGSIAATQLFGSSLSELYSDAGIIISGELRNIGGTNFVDLDASGSGKFLAAGDDFYVRANGSAYFAGEMASSELTASSVKIATGWGGSGWALDCQGLAVFGNGSIPGTSRVEIENVTGSGFSYPNITLGYGYGGSNGRAEASIESSNASGQGGSVDLDFKLDGTERMAITRNQAIGGAGVAITGNLDVSGSVELDGNFTMNTGVPTFDLGSSNQMLIKGSSADGKVIVRDAASSGQYNYIEFQDSLSNRISYVGYDGNENCRLEAIANDVIIGTSINNAVRINAGGASRKLGFYNNSAPQYQQTISGSATGALLDLLNAFHSNGLIVYSP